MRVLGCIKRHETRSVLINRARQATALEGRQAAGSKSSAATLSALSNAIVLVYMGARTTIRNRIQRSLQHVCIMIDD